MSDRSQAVGAARISSERHTTTALSRRALLAASAATVAGSALFGTSTRALAQSASTTAAAARRLRSRQPFGDLQLLVNRITQGYDSSVWRDAELLGYDGFLDQQLRPSTIDDSAMDARLQAFSTLTMSSKELYDAYGATQMYSVPINELNQAMVMRAVYSKRQLFERMVEFWTDHFNIDHADNECRILKTADDRDVIRAHALGKFPDLLFASMHSGAMLVYLDNYTSKKEAPNENYARELMELHTLGVGNYSEQDIKEVARCLTGWSRYSQSTPTYGDFRYIPSYHDNNPKTVLGHSILAGGGENDGLTVHSILSTHPATANFVGRKLCRWLLSYNPPQSVVTEVANTYLATGGDIKAMIRVILKPESVALADVDRFPKLKRPFHLVCSLLRAVNVQMTQPAKIVSELATLGQQPFAWSPPNGYPESLDAWGNALLPRWSFLSRLCSNSIVGSQVDVVTLFAGVPKTAIGARVNTILAGGALAPEDEHEVQLYVDSFATLTDSLRREAFALGASSPSYQYY